MRSRPSFVVLRRIAFLSLLVACGSRTGLFDDGESFDVIRGDGGPSGSATGEGGLDADVEGDGAIPPIDARPPTDVFRDDCPDAGALLVYTITDDYRLASFNPATGQFTTIGSIACPSQGEPFSMAVDRRGIAYVLYDSGELFRVSTATASCVATGYVPDQLNYRLFGMGFATLAGGPTETLYIAGAGQTGDDADGLARLATDTFTVSPVGPLLPLVSRAELTGTGDGRLFAFYRRSEFDDESYIGEIEPATANVIGERHFPQIDQGRAWAFAFWGGDFYMFHAPDDDGPGQPTTRVTRWRPADDTVVEVARTTTRIVGAGVSTCAPQQ